MKLNNLLLSPDPADGGGTGTAEAGEGQPQDNQPSTDVLEPPPGASDTAKGDVDTSTGGGDAANATGGTGAISKEDIEAILERVIPAAVSAGRTEEPQGGGAQTQPTYTQEQYDQMFNVYKPSADLIQRLRSEDPQVAVKAVIEMQQGIIKQAMTMAEYRMQQYRDSILKKYGDDLAPIQSFVTEQQATSFRNDFFKEYPDLEPYETIVDAVATKLQAQKWEGKDRKDVMKRFAEESQKVVESLLAKAGGNGNGAVAPGKKVVAFPATDKKRMSTLTGGGQGGTSRPGAAQAGAKGPPGIELFD